ncbi:MAG: Nif3-like dinuclear metal center hexameric protein [Bordetella sp.]|nr:MAG: Nif3-like dinuclear metal center hexameric protein [Bordetella sp.]
MNLIDVKDLSNWLDNLLKISMFEDYSPNGLQVEGKAKIARIITGVSASEALLKCAIKKCADAILVHHGWFWKNENPCIKGIKKTRLNLVLKHDINIFAYHLPLDAHPLLGNNAQLANILDITPFLDEKNKPITYGYKSLIWTGSLQKSKTLQELGNDIEKRLNRSPLIIGKPEKIIQSIAWCTGAAQNMFQDAINKNFDAFLTGEISEHNVHLARETNTGFISAGHHATERFGIQALGTKIAQEFGIEVEFIDIDNPV